MTLHDFSAAVKAKFRPVFGGGIEQETRAMEALANKIRAEANAIGRERALLAMTEGRGE